MKQLIILLLVIFSSSFSTILQAAQYSEAEVKALVSKSEAQLVAWLKKQGKNSVEITKAYLNAAEQSYMLHQNGVALVLYKKALKREDLENKIMAFLPIIEMELQANNIKNAKKFHQEAASYLKVNPGFSTQQVRERMTVFKLQISQQPSEKALTTSERENIEINHNNQMVYAHDLKQYLMNKNYDEAYQLIDGQDFTESDVNNQILADVVHTGANKPRSSLYCKKSYDLYPDSHETSYTMKLCGVLMEIKAGTKISEKDFNHLKHLLKANYPEKLYLEQVARDLANRK